MDLKRKRTLNPNCWIKHADRKRGETIQSCHLVSSPRRWILKNSLDNSFAGDICLLKLRIRITKVFGFVIHLVTNPFGFRAMTKMVSWTSCLNHRSESWISIKPRDRVT